MNQRAFLKKQAVDIDTRKGVCAAMVIEWLTRELSGKQQGFLFYKNAYQFASYQRALTYRCLIKNTTDLEFKSDRFRSIPGTSFNSYDLRNSFGMAKSGAFLVQMYSSLNWMYCIGIYMSNGVYKIFDPDYGEFQEKNKNNHRQALLECQKHIFQYYSILEAPYMKLTEITDKK